MRRGDERGGNDGRNWRTGAEEKTQRRGRAENADVREPDSLAAAPLGLPSRPEVAIHLQKPCRSGLPRAGRRPPAPFGLQGDGPRGRGERPPGNGDRRPTNSNPLRLLARNLVVIYREGTAARVTDRGGERCPRPEDLF